MTSKQTSAPLPAAEIVKSWLWVAVWVIVGAVVGTVLTYILFGLVWTNWDAYTGAIPEATPRRSGDSIDNWAKGYVAMMIAAPFVLAGFCAGTIAGFRLGYRRHQARTDCFTDQRTPTTE